MVSGGGNIFSYKRAIKQTEKRARDGYTVLGIRAYNLIKQGELKQEELEAVVADIDAAGAEIASYQEAIEVLQAQKAAAREAAREAARSAKCPSCGTVATAGSKFCPGCGGDLTGPAASSVEQKNCAKCGETIDADAAFCNACGGKQ